MTDKIDFVKQEKIKNNLQTNHLNIYNYIMQIFNSTGVEPIIYTIDSLFNLSDIVSISIHGKLLWNEDYQMVLNNHIYTKNTQLLAKKKFSIKKWNDETWSSISFSLNVYDTLDKNKKLIQKAINILETRIQNKLMVQTNEKIFNESLDNDNTIEKLINNVNIKFSSNKIEKKTIVGRLKFNGGYAKLDIKYLEYPNVFSNPVIKLYNVNIEKIQELLGLLSSWQGENKQ